ncbi:hypothetical protein ACSVH5_13430 [Flavobacterium sp. RSSA_27]|uniref:hypothetical protein n=1 Tax=Flavobacterium sp. RSSA_27 TaxID=3447667 RepID=UPI003F30EE65
MKNLNFILFVIPFLFYSCSSKIYPEDYEPIRVFLKTQKDIDKNKMYILKYKESNTQTLRIFNRGEGEKHIIFPNQIDFTSKIFNELHWKKLYAQYSNEKTEKYWREEDFRDFKILDRKRNQLFDEYHLFHLPKLENVIILSEPIWYYNKRYILFYFSIDNMYNSSKPSLVVIMKKVKKKWIVVQEIGDYACSGCY